MPTLRSENSVTKDHQAKVAALRTKFYPVTQADLSDISSQTNQAPFTVEQTITKEEISEILSFCSSSSAPGDNEIPFSFLKLLGAPVIKALTNITNTS